jgi:hypothetical protein
MTLALPERAALDLATAPTAGPVDLTPEQIRVLLMGMAENRVQHLKGNAHTEAWDIRRWLTRIFGFGGWTLDTTELALVREIELKQSDPNKPRWTVIYRAQVRLTVRTVDGRPIASYEDAAMGDSQNQPQLGAAHDQAMKTALSQGLKRCAVNLGDQFGLSLYNNGSAKPVVLKSVAHPSPAADGAPPVPEQDEPVQPEQAPEPMPEVQQAPVVQAERPRSVDTAPRRDYIAEAREARTPQEFAAIRTAAVAAGCSDEYADALDRIAGDKRAAAEQLRAGQATNRVYREPQAGAAPDPLPGSPDDPKARGMAVVDMYAAGRDNALTPGEVQQAFTNRYKHGVDAATAAELAEFTADLTAAAGAR